MPKTVMSNTISSVIGDPIVFPAPEIVIKLYPRGGCFRIDDGTEIATEYRTSAAGGNWSANLERSSNIDPEDSFYVVDEMISLRQGGPKRWAFRVPDAGPAILSDNLISPVDGSGIVIETPYIPRLLPVGGVAGDHLLKTGPTDGAAIWQSFNQDLEQHYLSVMRRFHYTMAAARLSGGRLHTMLMGDSISEGWIGNAFFDEQMYVYRLQKALSEAIGNGPLYGKHVPGGADWWSEPNGSANGTATYLTVNYVSGGGVLTVNSTVGFPAAGAAVISSITDFSAQPFNYTGVAGNTLTGCTNVGNGLPFSGNWTAAGTSTTVTYGASNVAKGTSIRARYMPVGSPPAVLTFTGDRCIVRYRVMNVVGSCPIRIKVDGATVFDGPTLKQDAPYCNLANGERVVEYNTGILALGSHSVSVEPVAGAGPYDTAGCTLDSWLYFNGDYACSWFINASHFATQMSTFTVTDNPTTNRGWLSTVRQGLDEIDLFIISHGTNTGTTPGTLLGQLTTTLSQVKAALDVAGNTYPSVVYFFPPVSFTKDEAAWNLVRNEIYFNMAALALPYIVIDWSEFTGPVNIASGDPIGWTSNGGGYIHPNGIGHNAIGDFLVSKLLKYQVGESFD